MSFRIIFPIFFWWFLSMLLFYWNIKKKGSPDFFSCKSFPETSNSHARSRAFKNPDPLYRQLFMICYGYRWQLRVLARAPTASDLMFWNVYCSESHSAAVKDSLPGPPWKMYFQLLTILAIFLLKNNERKFEMENTCWLALRSECLFRDCESSNR